MVDFVIAGSPGGVRARSAALRERAGRLSAVGEALGRLSTGGWSGRAAEHFRAAFEVEPGRWADAGRGFLTAATSLDEYADALVRAQQRAAAARLEFARGEAATHSARASYELDLLRDRERSSEQLVGGFAAFVAPDFHDAGEPIRAGALSEMAQTRAELAVAAAACAAGVRAGCVGAPETRSWLETGLDVLGRVFGGAGEALGSLLTMPGSQSWVWSQLRAVATGQLTEEELRAQVGLAGEQAVALGTSLRDDPGELAKEVGKAALDSDTWSDDPARAVGHLVPDAALAVLTAGAAGGAAATTAGAARATYASLAEELAAGRVTLDAYADAVEGLSASRAVHAGSATAPDLEALMQARYPGILDVNRERFLHGDADLGLGPEAFRDNCTRCVIAADQTLAGTPTRAHPVLPGDSVMGQVVVDALGDNISPPLSYDDVVEVVQTLGPGGRGVVMGTRPGGDGHVFNVVNDSGTIVFLDAQTGEFAELEPFRELCLLISYP